MTSRNPMTTTATPLELPSWAAEYLGADVDLDDVTAPTEASQVLTHAWLTDTYVHADRSIADVAAIASEEFGLPISEADVHTALDRHQILWRNGASPTPELTRDLLVQRYLRGGESLQEIADDLGVSRETVRQARERFGLPRRRWGLSGRVSSDQLQELYVDQGMSIREVAVELETSPSAVSRVLNEVGIEARSPVAAEEVVDVEQVIARYRSGASIRSIAADVELSDTTVRDLLLRQGVELRGKRRLHQEVSAQQLEQLFDEGLEVAQVAERLSCTPKSVYRLLKRYGIERSAA